LFGGFKAAPDVRFGGPAAGAGYVLPSRRKVKAAAVRKGSKRFDIEEINTAQSLQPMARTRPGFGD